MKPPPAAPSTPLEPLPPSTPVIDSIPPSVLFWNAEIWSALQPLPEPEPDPEPVPDPLPEPEPDPPSFCALPATSCCSTSMLGSSICSTLTLHFTFCQS